MSRIPFVLAVLLTAGCLAPTPSADPLPSPSESTTFGADAEGCAEAIALFLVDFGELRRFLPEGWEPRDAQAALETPAPVGRGAVFVTGIACDRLELENGTGSIAEGGILVERPAVAEGLDEGLDFYTPVFMHEGAATVALLEASGVAQAPASASVSTDASLPVVRGDVEVADGEGTLYAYTFEAPARDTLAGVVRLWQQVPAGHVVFELDIPSHPIAKGGLTSCELRDGSPYAEIAGITTCGPGDGFALVFLEQGWDGEFRVLPAAP